MSEMYRPRGRRHSGVRHLVVVICASTMLLFGPAAGGVASAEPLPPPPFETQGLVMDVFHNGFGDPVSMRRGYWSADAPRRGFGFMKITQKHAIFSRALLASIVSDPDSVTLVQPGRYVHESTTRHVVCEFQCTVVESVLVRVVIDYNDFAGQGQMGILTAYCVNPDQAEYCPAYVNRTR